MDELYQEVVSVIRMNRQGLTLDAMARAMKEALTKEEVDLLIERLSV